MDTQILNDSEYDDLLNDIYTAAMTGNWQPSLKKIADVTISNIVFFFILDVKTQLPRAFEFSCNFDYDVNILNHYLEHPTEDPFYHAIKHLPEGVTYDMTDYLDINEHIDTDFHKRVLTPMKSHHVIGSTFIVNGLIDSRFAINREPEDEPYTKNELALIKSLTPHYQRAVKIYNALHDEKRKLKFNEAIVAQTNQAMLLLNHKAEVLLQSEKTDALINNTTEFQINDRRFLITEIRDAIQFKDRLRLCIEDKLPQSDIFLVLSSKNNKRAYKLEFKLIKSSLFINEFDEDIVLVTIHNNYSLDLVALEQEFELTHTELKVLTMYYERHSLDEVAMMLGCVRNTIRNHLATLYTKLRVSSQTELMSKLRLFQK